MDSKEREKVSEIIRNQISELESSIEDLSAAKQQVSDHSENDEAIRDIHSTAQVNETTHLQMKEKLKRLYNNLDWVWCDHGGECEECGQKIPIERLTIVPTTRLCVDCSSKHEE